MNYNHQRAEAAAWMQLARSHERFKIVSMNRHIYTNQVHEFCNLEMATNGPQYIKNVNGKKTFDAHKMANEYIFQHALEEANLYESTLETVYQWWERSVFKTKHGL